MHPQASTFREQNNRINYLEDKRKNSLKSWLFLFSVELRDRHTREREREKNGGKPPTEKKERLSLKPVLCELKLEKGYRMLQQQQQMSHSNKEQTVQMKNSLML